MFHDGLKMRVFLIWIPIFLPLIEKGDLLVRLEKYHEALTAYKQSIFLDHYDAETSMSKALP